MLRPHARLSSPLRGAREISMAWNFFRRNFHGMEFSKTFSKLWVMTAEHLVAIALDVGRAKDFARIVQFIESGTINRDKLDDILSRRRLGQKWETFRLKFLKDLK